MGCVCVGGGGVWYLLIIKNFAHHLLSLKCLLIHQKEFHYSSKKFISNNLNLDSYFVYSLFFIPTLI